MITKPKGIPSSQGYEQKKTEKKIVTFLGQSLIYHLLLVGINIISLLFL